MWWSLPCDNAIDDVAPAASVLTAYDERHRMCDSRLPFGFLDLHDVSAEIAELHSRERAGDRPA
jgi:hypothetical protein